jgi:predicted nucleic acid-binding protein
VAYLVDTSVLVRLANLADSLYPAAARAVTELHHRRETLHIAPQNLVEFRSVATRPTEQNGLGLPPAVVEAQIDSFEGTFSLLSETPDIYPIWKALVSSIGVIGKQVHDARLVAVCHVHGITSVLTFNVAHFTSLAAFAPGISVVDPINI